MEEDRSRVFSPSKLDVYKNCPRRYRFRYVDRLRSEGTSVEALLGTSVHSAFEQLYEARQHGKLLSEAEVAAVFEKEWSAGLQAKAVSFKDSRFGPEDWRRAGLECVANYYRANAPFDADRTIAVEKRIGFRLPVQEPGSAAPVECRIEGYMDRLAVAADGAFEIHDYKTGLSLPTQAQKDQDWQLALYEIGVREAWPDVPGVRLVWHYVRHGKKIVSTRDAATLGALKEDVASLVHRIWSDREFAPVRSPLCDWCEFRDRCPLFKHPEAYAQLPPEERVHESGVRLADEYAALEERKHALRSEIAAVESEQETLEKKIVEYARAHDVAALAGTDCELELHEREELKFPTKTGAPERFELMEAEIRASPAWPHASRVDPRAAIEALRSGALAREILDALKAWVDRWGRPERKRSLRVRRRREAEE